MKPPKISVVIPSFNKGRYIGQTLESIVSQKYENIEVIIQDGGSTDTTLRTIKKYAKKYSRIIKWESEIDEGQLDAINRGLSKAKGDIFTFINADDTYEPNAFRLISKAYNENPKALWFAGEGVVINEKGLEIAVPVSWYKSFCLHLNTYYLLLIFNFLMQPSVFITKKAYKKYGPFTGTRDFVTEYDLWLKLGKDRMPVVVDRTLSRFRIEPLTKTKRMFVRLLAEDRKIVERYTQNPLILFLHELHNFGRELVRHFV